MTSLGPKVREGVSVLNRPLKTSDISDIRRDLEKELSTTRIDGDNVQYATLISSWWFQTFLFSPLFGEDSHFDYIIFFKWVETTTQIWYRNYFISAKKFLVWSFQDDLDIFVFCLNYLGTYTTEVVVQSSYLMSELILDDYIWGLCTFMHCSCVSSPCIGVIMLYASILFYIHTHMYIFLYVYKHILIHP